MMPATGLGASHIIAFIPTRNAENAKAFYEDTLGLTFQSDDGFALVFDANGTMLRIARVAEFQPLPFTTLGWEVADITAAVTALTAKGVVFERFGFLRLDELGIWAAPGGAAQVAWFKDPDGNTLSLSQHSGIQ